MGINKYSDLDIGTINKVMHGLRVGKRDPNRIMGRAPPTIADLPPAVNWTSRGVMGPVKDQGQCGSCFSFATTGALEAHYALATNNRTRLSEQNLVDCTYWYVP